MFNGNNFFLIRQVSRSFDWIVTYVNKWNYNLITYANNLHWCVNNWNYNLFNCANNLYIVNLNIT